MKITIPKPCHENWETMTREEKGRFCSVCSKKVRDFTVASDEEIIDVFSSSTEEICGHFYESQLNRNLQYSYINSVLVKFAVGFILTTGGLVSVQAQQNAVEDTLKTKELGGIVLIPSRHHASSSLTGTTTVVSEADLMVHSNDSSTGASKSTGLQMNQLPQRNAKDAIRIGGAKSSLRQDHQPLVVLNGKVSDLKSLQQIDPALIETVNTFDGASATALCGSKAQNGVIVVTTKKKWKAKK
ncbi:TonB-dependent receptor plug domain-containing protein [Chryseobacterium sp. Y16C]|uniref:TonB-dependent receptor plug domain-containing protein n=1 Tax=Chryseobacterium sp. Y16C TaxID=2920939 RepID=UPI001F0A21AE|nr:TonB-dependent receptor plug domain-containing protein [Chryseobacterium sp. Y16C]UMQ42972.1 TonB-dependent receptor plug domain-containing protein [Chryseobacterium sp. Y16C]